MNKEIIEIRDALSHIRFGSSFRESMFVPAHVSHCRSFGFINKSKGILQYNDAEYNNDIKEFVTNILIPQINNEHINREYDTIIPYISKDKLFKKLSLKE